MAKAALRDVSKATVEAPANTLAALIDQAGDIRERRSALDKAYNKLRTEIEGHLEIPTPGSSTHENGEQFYADLKFHTEKQVKLRQLFKNHPDVFWALVNVPVKALEDALGPQEAHKLVTVDYKTAPSLTIERIKG